MDKLPDPGKVNTPVADSPKPIAGVGGFTRPLDYWLLWLVVVGLMALNLYLARTLLDARSRALALVNTVTEQALQAVSDFQAASFTYTVEVDQTIPLTLNVPIDQVLPVPVQTSIPISTVVTLSLETPLGRFPINVPIVTTVPISLTAQVPIRFTVPVSEAIPIQLSVPIQIKIADTALMNLLEELKVSLGQVRQEALGEPREE